MAGPGDAVRISVIGVEGVALTWPREPDGLTIDAERSAPVRALPSTAADRAAGRRRFEVSVDGWIFQVVVESEARARLHEQARQRQAGPGAHEAQRITAQIPGRVVRLWVEEGATVEAGQRLLAIEAMKMENEVRAARAGMVEQIRVSLGSSVELGDELIIVR